VVIAAGLRLIFPEVAALGNLTPLKLLELYLHQGYHQVDRRVVYTQLELLALDN
jgi:hypothetical protein